MTQTEFPCEHDAVQVTGSRANNCVRCNQVGDLLSLVVQLKGEVEGLRTIRECEKETGWWSHSAVTETNTAHGHLRRRGGSPTCSPPGRWRGPK